MKKEILLIVNPCSGKGKVNKYVPEICDNLEKQGYELEVIYTSETNNGEKIIENYIRYIDAVVVLLKAIKKLMYHLFHLEQQMILHIL